MKRLIKHTIFLASPGDVDEERRAVRRIVQELNPVLERYNQVTFRVTGFEDVVAPRSARRRQDLINPLVQECTIFMLILHRRWGQSAPDSPEETYTMEEYSIARIRSDESEGEMPLLFYFLKRGDDDARLRATLSQPDVKQWEAVDEFRRQLQNDQKAFPHDFASCGQLEATIRMLLFEIARGEIKPREVQLAGASFAHKVGAPASPQPVSERQRPDSVHPDDAAANSAYELAFSGQTEAARQAFLNLGATAQTAKALSRASSFFLNVWELDNAEFMALKGLGIAGKTGDPVGEAALLLDLANLQRVRGRPNEARELVDKAIATNKGRSASIMARAHASRGQIFDHLGQYGGARRSMLDALREYKRLQDTNGVRVQLCNLAGVAKLTGQLGRSDRLYVLAKRIAENSDDHLNTLIMELNLVSNQSTRGNYERVLELIEPLLIRTRQFHIDYLTAMALGMKAAAQSATEKDLEEVIRTFEQVLDIYEGSGASLDASRTAATIVGLLMETGQHDRAAMWVERLERIASEVGTDPVRAMYLGQLGSLEWAKREPLRAEAAWQEALRLELECHRPYAVGELQRNLAVVDSSRGRQASALKRIKESTEIFHSIGNRRDFALSLAVWASVLLDGGDPSGARQKLIEAKTVFQTLRVDGLELQSLQKFIDELAGRLDPDEGTAVSAPQ